MISNVPMTFRITPLLRIFFVIYWKYFSILWMDSVREKTMALSSDWSWKSPKGIIPTPFLITPAILDVLGKDFVKLREEIEWGYTIPYMITGILDLHPRAGMKLRNSEDKDKYLGFYEKLTSEANV